MVRKVGKIELKVVYFGQIIKILKKCLSKFGREQIKEEGLKLFMMVLKVYVTGVMTPGKIREVGSLLIKFPKMLIFLNLIFGIL